MRGPTDSATGEGNRHSNRARLRDSCFFRWQIAAFDEQERFSQRNQAPILGTTIVAEHALTTSDETILVFPHANALCSARAVPRTDSIWCVETPIVIVDDDRRKRTFSEALDLVRLSHFQIPFAARSEEHTSEL